MSDRKMATIRRIDKIEPIEGADKIVCATVGGWKLVTAIDNGFKEGDLVIYCEIDSWIPTEVAPFLSKGNEPRMFNGIRGEKLKTIKLRGQVSQGLLLPLSVIDENKISREQYLTYFPLTEDTDVTSILGIQKWEAPLNAQLAGVARGTFPSWGRKTDQERIQNMKKEFAQFKSEGLTFEVTEKLEGSSMSVYFKDGEFGVCSRNMNLKETEGNSFWIAARELMLEEKLIAIGANTMLQGELIGPGIQGNIYGLTKFQFRLFDVFDIDTHSYFNSEARANMAVQLGIPHAPVISSDHKFMEIDTMESALTMAEGKSQLASVEREGLVFKCVENPEISFKVISNLYLLKQKD